MFFQILVISIGLCRSNAFLVTPKLSNTIRSQTSLKVIQVEDFTTRANVPGQLGPLGYFDPLGKRSDSYGPALTYLLILSAKF